MKGSAGQKGPPPKAFPTRLAHSPPLPTREGGLKLCPGVPGGPARHMPGPRRRAGPQ